QNALPEAREGREIRFLFLPEGQDPDTLVAAEGREAFEQRLDREALLLSEYFVRELGERIPTGVPTGGPASRKPRDRCGSSCPRASIAACSSRVSRRPLAFSARRRTRQD